MVLQGTALVGTFTFSFSVSGKRNDWKITITSPNGVVDERETDAAGPYSLFNDMLANACDHASHSRIPAPAGAQR
jgi:hypothetical protein